MISPIKDLNQETHGNIISLSVKQHDSFLSSFRISTIIVTMAERNVFVLNNWISCNRQQALLFENPSRPLPCAIHLLALIGLSETALGGSCPRVSLRGEALLSLVCDWQNGIRCFEQTGGAACRLYSLYTCPYTCTHAHTRTHVHTHTRPHGRAGQTDSLLLSTMRTQPGNACAHTSVSCQLFDFQWLDRFAS